jgi:hypothetical protein
MGAGMSGRVHIAIFVIACLVGLLFASVSTYDFAQHLDRQVHDLHCSFVPGLATKVDDGGAAGCQVTLMSPYSSVLRAKFWGGIPISLPAMGVFAFLAFRGFDLLGRRGAGRRKAAAVLFGLSTLPVIASLVMGVIAMVELDAACKLCIGIYGASLVSFLAAGLAFMAIRRAPEEDDDKTDPGPVGIVALAQLAGFVAVPVLAWVVAMPDYSRYIGTCGKLSDTADKGKIMIPLDQNNGAASIEVFDPLCPACRAFDRRLAASGLDVRLHRMAVLFPLDKRCNWNVDSSMHPGACTVSEAILCAEAGAGNTTPAQVIQWAFEVQEKMREAAKVDPEKIEPTKDGKPLPRTVAERMVDERFPDLAACVGSDEVRQRLNRSVRWAVAHSIPVVTPQLYVEGTKLCPEDTDLGLEYGLTGLLARANGGAR